MSDYLEETGKTRDRYNRLALLYDLDDVLWLGSKQYSRKKLIKATNLGDSGMVLDLTSGTGRNAGLLARWVKNGTGQPSCSIMTRWAGTRNTDSVELIRPGGRTTFPMKSRGFPSTTTTHLVPLL